jgi:parallel beta-helix repeat protein
MRGLGGSDGGRFTRGEGDWRPFSVREVQADFYVAPNGNDAWSGRLPEPNEEGTDGPFATISRARDAIRELKRQYDGTLKQPVNIFIRGGVYFLKEPLIFTPEDSGTREYPITYTAYKEEVPIISGGEVIKNWKEGIINGKKIWEAEIPDVRRGRYYFHQIWVNGQRRLRARHPNRGYFQIAQLSETALKEPREIGQLGFYFYKGDLKAWSTITEADIVVMNRWVESHLPIERIDEKSNFVCASRRSVFHLDPGDLYYVENCLECLDSPGEWYLERKTGKFYYMPEPDEKIGETEIIIPRLTQLIRIEGKPEENQFVEHIKFSKLTFSYTEWWFPEYLEVGGFAQADIGVPGAIYGEGAYYCTFEDCKMAHLGSYAIELSRGCQNNSIIRCDIFDLAGGGIKIGETVCRDKETDQTGNNVISDCHIYNGGLIFHSAVGIWIGQSYKNIISHNHIHDFYYTGISIGWTWGYGQSFAYGNIVEFNHIHHIGILSDGDGPILSDMGGIYTLGIQPGTTVQFNLIHDIAGLRYGGWGIYFDEGSSYILAENNIVYNTTHGGFHQHYGAENIIRNNIFAFGRDAQIQRTRPEEHLSFRFEHNIVYWEEGELLAGKWDDFNFMFDYNLYWCKGDKISFCNLSWEEWQKRGMDRHSLIADPLFENPRKGNFQIRTNSPIKEIGIVPIDLSKIGPRGEKVLE